MSRMCQTIGCGRPANFAARTRRNKCTGRNDHDVCRRCWRKLLEAANVADREEWINRRAAVEAYWQRQEQAA